MSCNIIIDLAKNRTYNYRIKIKNFIICREIYNKVINVDIFKAKIKA